MGKMKKYRQLIKELPSKKVVFAFGRFQPPTTGHELLVKAVQKIASAQGADHVIYASKTEDKKQNPLPVSRKVYYLQRMFDGANFKAANETERTFIEAAKALNKRYKNIVMVAGSDRIAEYKKILEKYNGTEFKFDTVSVVSAGERDPDSDNASGMSGTKMRDAAKAGKFSEFKKGIPHSLTVLDARRLMNEIRKAYDLDPIKESLNIPVDDLREKYFHGEIFNVGDIVVSENKRCVVVKRGSNHLLLTEEGTDVKFTRWIKDVNLPAEKVEEELTNKTLKSSTADQIKAARIIATTLGVDNVEAISNPAQIVNLGLRKIKSKALNAESYEILKRMLKLATDVGIKFDANLMPQKLKEAYYNKLLSYDADGKMTEIDTDKDDIPDWIERNMTKVGSSVAIGGADILRKQNIHYHLGEADTGNLSRQVAKSALAAKHAREKEALSTKHASEKESLKTEAYQSYSGPSSGHAYGHTGFGKRPREDDEYHVPDPVDRPHAVHINGKKWKTFGSHSHATNVANKIKGATVHKEEVEHIDELSSDLLARYKKKASDQASAADKAGDYAKGNKRFSGIIKATKKQFNNDLKEEHIVHVDDGSNYGDKPHPKDVEHVNAGVKKHGGVFDGHSDKGAYFKFKSQSDAKNFADHVKKAPHKSVYADLHEDYEQIFNALNEAVASIDKGEYDYEGAMAKTQLQTVCRNAQDLIDMLEMDDNLPEWVQSKITLAQDYISSVTDYLKSRDELGEGYVQAADQKIGKDGKKHAARLIKIGSDAPTNVRQKGYDAFSMEGKEENLNLFTLSEEDIDVIVDSFQTWEDVIDAYEDDELAIIDEETGEEIDDVVSESAINEVLSRIERIRAKTRFARTKSKRMIKTKMALKRSSPQSVINTRARKLAIQTIKLRLAKKPLNTLSVAEKERLEQRIAKMKPVLNRIAMKLAPRVRQIEKQRLSHSTYTKK